MDAILLDGDWVEFQPVFAPAVVTVRPAQLVASGHDAVGGRRMCVEGDERTVRVDGCPYVSAQYVSGGIGVLTIQMLHPTSLARKTTSLGRKVLLKGGPFVARFQVTAPAVFMAPTGQPIPDPMPLYTGSGLFRSAGMIKQGE